MKKFWLYLKDNNIITSILIIIFCTIVFILRENVDFQSQTIVYVNLILVGLFFLMLYNAVRKHYIRYKYILCIVFVLFVFNKYYNEEVFWKTFHFKALYFYIIIGFVAVIGILLPVIKNCLKRSFGWISNGLGEWTRKRLEEEKRSREKDEKKHVIKRKTINTINEGEKEKRSDDSKIEKKYKKKIPYKKDVILFILVFFVLFLTPIGLLVFSVNEQSLNILERITYNNISTAVLSLAVTVVFLVFVTGIMVSLIIKWYQIIKDIICERHKGEMYFVYACGLFFVSQYVFSNYSYTTDDIADLLLSGKIFTFPLVLSILVPIFLIFAENIVAFTSKNPEIKNKLKKSADRTINIANGIIDSLLTFIQFVTSDYLSTIIELSDEDDSSNANSNKKGDGNNIG